MRSRRGPRSWLLVAPSNGTEALVRTFEYAVKHQLAQVVSMSFGAPEFGSDGSDEMPWGLATAEAAAYGIGVTVSTGDSGDNGAGQPAGAPSTPADSAYVTAVGGTTLSFPTAEGRRDVGWGWQSSYPKHEPDCEDETAGRRGPGDRRGRWRKRLFRQAVLAGPAAGPGPPNAGHLGRSPIR